MMAVTPVLYVGYLSASARLGSLGEIVFEGDPPGFSERLEAYRPLVVASARLAKSEDNAVTIESVIEEVSKGLPRLESTRFGATAEQDVRSPIVTAQQRAFDALERKLRQLNKNGRVADAIRLAVDGFAIADILRLSDLQSLSRSTRFQVLVVNSIKPGLSRVSPDVLEHLTNKLIVYESRRPQLRVLVRNEMDLLVAESNFWAVATGREEALKLAMQAMRAALSGESIVRFIRQAAEIEHSRIRDDVCRTLVALEVAMKSEDQSQRLIRSLIVEARSRQLAMRGERFDSQVLLRLPKEVFSETIHRRVPKLVVNKGYACLEFGKPGDGIVAAR